MIPDEAVEAAVNVAVLEDLAPPCDVGRSFKVNGGKEPVCGSSADWTALVHDCHLGRPALLCTKHLAMCRSDAAPSLFVKWQCKRCGLLAVSADELIWNVRRMT